MDRKRKILIAYATAGIGHKKAAFAIHDALKNKSEDLEIRLIDVLDYTYSFFRRSYLFVYLVLINRLIWLWGFFYYTLDLKMAHRFIYPLRKMTHVLNAGALVRLIADYKPDVAVSTHFLLPDICDYVKKRYKLTMKVINVLTDYRAHSFWVSGGVDVYIVAHDETKKDLTGKWGVNPDNVRVMGIPVEPKFSAAHDRNYFRNKLGIQSGAFTVLMIGGGYGVGPIYRLLLALKQSGMRLSVITVCGHNRSLYDRINVFKKAAGGLDIKNFGYTDNVDELMAASDVYIGKAGGISTTEALCQQLPLIFIRSIHGQEKRNEELMVMLGAAARLRSVKDISGIIRECVSSGKRLELFKEGIKKVRKINAARDIADFIIGLSDEK